MATTGGDRMTALREKVRQPFTQGLLQTALVAALIVVGWQVHALSERARVNEQAVNAVNGILSRSCEASDFEALRDQGIVEECRLARQGELPQVVVDREASGEALDDLAEDDPTATPGDLLPEPDVSTAVREQVDLFFAENPLTLQPGYRRSLDRSVATFLDANPPDSGRPPTQGEVRAAVRTVLVANPPPAGPPGADGSSGADGRSVIGATTDGCDVVLALSDGTRSRVGPLCGPAGVPGPPPTEGEIADAVVAFCRSNGECQGPPGPPGVVQTIDDCTPEPGRVVTDVSISGPEGNPPTVTVSCVTRPLSEVVLGTS